MTDILKDEVAELARCGAEYIQIDAPEFGMLIDEHQRAWFAQKCLDPYRMIHDGIEMINTIIDGYPGTTFSLHICRGNDANRYMTKDDSPELFKAEAADLLYHFLVLLQAKNLELNDVFAILKKEGDCKRLSFFQPD